MNWKSILKSRWDPHGDRRAGDNFRGQQILIALRNGLLGFISRWPIEVYEDIIASTYEPLEDRGTIVVGPYFFSAQYYDENEQMDFDAYDKPEEREKRINSVLKGEGHYAIVVSIDHKETNPWPDHRKTAPRMMFFYHIYNGGQDPNFYPLIRGGYAGSSGSSLDNFDMRTDGFKGSLGRQYMDFLATLVDGVNTLPTPNVRRLGGGSS